ncbi:carbon-nitrogen hydrolase family protein [Methylobrevis albus]|uniref:Carbon-nitrogen hydrolase family protein n=1 Tax=Methylobrevis albus TaxID=2793297 RepID=A0A931HZ86_9HYPH|nr:carbon-nitrogen hydrolase family protein [Methylobrevis albus]MBH0236341.1 carbon-nitrogen hydrolase family protein [Methylobrevis albus]
MSRRFIVAAAQYPIEEIASIDAYEAKVARWIGEAAAHGAKLAVFPEYGIMELAAAFPHAAGDLALSLGVLGPLVDEVDALHQALARRHDMHILASSAPVQGGDGRYRNVARLFTPQGTVGRQEKLVMTRFERDSWDIAAGSPIRVFRTKLGLIGVSICYDVEFPLIARAQAEAGAELILCPSATDTLKGYWRVRIGAQARALENQCYVVHAPTVGDAPWSPAMDTNRGAAGLYGPPDAGFPDDGVVAVGDLDQATWLFAEVDLDKVTAVRADGAVLNFRHWSEQGGADAVPPAGPVAEIVDLT